MANSNSSGRGTSFWMALLAIIISLIGTGVSIIEAGILRDQQELMVEEKEAAVWPYVSAGVTIDNQKDGTTITYELNNEGVGPALIGDIQHNLDGAIGVLSEVLEPLRAKYPDLSIIPLLISSTTKKVLGAGETFTVYRLYIKQKVDANSDPLQVSAAFTTTYCYCSVYGACWNQDGARLAADAACGGKDYLQ